MSADFLKNEISAGEISCWADDEVDAEEGLSLVSNFDDMGLSDNLLRGIYGYGFEHPSAIQQRAIRPIIEKRDLIAQAQSGTGKTGSFAIAALQRVSPQLAVCQVLMLSPTRELAHQTFKVVCALADYLRVAIRECVGGTSVSDTIESMRQAQVVIGTPGRVCDMLRRGALLAGNVRLVVIDEADEMLSRGFKDQIYDIFQETPPEVQVALFSATMPPEALQLAVEFMCHPVAILVKQAELTLEGIRQFYVHVGQQESDKQEVLIDLYASLSIGSSVIFCNTRSKVDQLADLMRRHNFPVSCIHSDLSPKGRAAVMKGFREGVSRVLITTNLVSRGIDVQQVSLVMNYDLPTRVEIYLHRIGRSARFGRKGIAINLVSQRDAPMLLYIEKYYGTQIVEMPADIGQFM